MKNEIGKFRPKKNSFTVTSNYIIFDSSLDLATKSLHTLINYYLSIPNFTLYKAHIQKHTGLGDKAFSRMWRLLKDKGYLIQHKLKDPRGIFYYEYELLDQPLPQEAPLDKATPDTVAPAEVGAINNTLNNKTLSNKTIKKEQQQEIPAAVPSHLDQDLRDTYLKAFNQYPNAMVEEQLLSYIYRFEKDVVLLAIEMAGIKQKNIDYAYGILRVWSSQNAYTFDQVVDYEEAYL